MVPPPRDAQRGVSVISLMVGMLLSLVVILVMLALYKVVVRSLFGSDGMVRNARQDGMLASGLLGAQVSLQEAGFGIPGASVGTSFVALKAAGFDARSGSLSGTVQAITTAESAVEVLLWESNPTQSADSTSWDCKALWSGRSDDGQPLLYLLQAAKPCHPVADKFAKLNWSHSVLIPEQLLSEPVGLRVQTVGACWPFGAVPQAISGMAPQGGILQAKLIARNSSKGTATEPAERPSVVCLPNFSS